MLPELEGMSPQDVDEAIAEGIRQGIVIVTRDRSGGLRFHHRDNWRDELGVRVPAQLAINEILARYQ